MSIRDLGVALLIVVVWGANFVAIRLGLSEIPPMLVICLRFLFSSIPAIFFFKKPQLPWRYILSFGLFMGAIQGTFLYSAIKIGMPAGLSSIIAQTQAFFTLLISALILKERVRGNQIVGMLIAASGLAIIALRFDQPVTTLQLLLVLGSALSWGISNIITRLANRVGRIEVLPFVVWSSLVVPLPMLIVSVMFEGVGAIITAIEHISLTSLLAIGYSAYLSTILGYTLWAWLIGKYDVGRVAPFSLLVPFFGLSSTAVMLGESITPMTLVAGSLIIIGLTINVFGWRWGQKLILKRKSAVAER
jgi:O-acetylserine/cysteine efflux transporter